jgi:hypothetical protein
VFCLRDEPDVLDPDAILERERVVSFRRMGKRLAVAIDRPQRKRCDFLFLTKPCKNRPGSYEQIFLRTEAAVKQHRNRGRREPLPVGDYALGLNGEIAALVERKAFENMLHEVAQIRGFHQQLADLARFRPAAVGGPTRGSHRLRSKTPV